MIKYEGQEPKAVGCVYYLGEHNYYNDSDFYASFLDLEEGLRGYEEYDTTRFAGGGYATIDLDFEHLNEWWKKAKENERKMIYNSLLNDYKTVSKGKKVIVNAGRKVPHGTVGEVFYTKNVNYDPYGRKWHDEVKIGIKDENENVFWTYAKNVDVINPEQYITEEDVNNKLKRVYDEFFNMAADIQKVDADSMKEFYKF